MIPAVAVSCEFDRQDCQHSALFSAEYKRTNRTKGTKILRCFPHCCPGHVGRSYCGSALFVNVARARSDVLVFAHFEEADAHVLRVGDTVPASHIAASIQTEHTPKGEWIEGSLHSSVAATENNSSAHVFEINASARWYYEWGSAATKAQRFTKHVLRVYVFERLSRGCAGALALSIVVPDSMLRVVTVATSSSFMVVSYRRAADETRADRRLLALLATNAGMLSPGSSAFQTSPSMDGDSDSGGGTRLSFDSSSLQRALLAASRSEKLDSTSSSRSHRRNQRRTLRASSSASPDYSSSNNSESPRVTHSSSLDDDDDAERVWQEEKLWESAHPETLMRAKHLAILHCFLGAVDATRFTQSLSLWSAMFAHDWSSNSNSGHTTAIGRVHSPPSPSSRSSPPQQQRFHPYASQPPPPRNKLLPRDAVASTRISWHFLIELTSRIEQAGQATAAAATTTTAPMMTDETGAARERSNSSSYSPPNERLSRLVELCADVAGRLVFSADNVRLFEQLFADASASLFGKQTLRDAFVNWTRLVYDLIGCYLAAVPAASPMPSMRRGVSDEQHVEYASTQQLVEAIIAIVFQSAELQPIRSTVLTILSTTSMHGLTHFVAQVRSHFVRSRSNSSIDTPMDSSSSSRTRNDMALTRFLHVFASPLHGRWVFDGTHSVVEPLDFAHVHRISLVNTLDWLRECSNVEIDVQDDQRLAIRSLWAVSSDSNASDRASRGGGMALVADGVSRVFSHFPSGLSSMIPLGGRRYGDYQANFTTPDSLVLELYAWSELSSSRAADPHERTVPQWGSSGNSNSETRPAIIRMQLHLSLERFGRPTAPPSVPVLLVEATLELGFCDAQQSPMTDDSSLRARLAAVSVWEPAYQVSATYRRAQSS